MFIYSRPCSLALCSDLMRAPSRAIVVFVRVADGGEGVLDCAESGLLAFLLSHGIRCVELAEFLGHTGGVGCPVSLPPRCSVAP